MPSEKDKILEFYQYMKFNKMQHIIYTDMEFLIKEKDGWVNHPENSSTTKIRQHIPCGYSMSTLRAFNNI